MRLRERGGGAFWALGRFVACQDLILKMARAKDAAAFVAAFDSRLGEIVLPGAWPARERSFLSCGRFVVCLRVPGCPTHTCTLGGTSKMTSCSLRRPASGASGEKRGGVRSSSLFREQGAVPQSPKSVRMKRRPSMDEARPFACDFAVLMKLGNRQPHLVSLFSQPNATVAFRTLSAVLPSS